MAALVTQLVGLIGSAFATGSSPSLVQSLPIHPEHQWFMPLQGALAGLSDHDLSQASLKTQLSMVPADARPPLAALLVAALRAVRDYTASPDAAGAYAEFRAMVAVHVELHKLYSSQDGDGGYAYPCLNGLVVEVCHRLVELSAAAAALSTAPIRDEHSARQIKDTTRQCIERSLQVSASHMPASEWAAELNRNDSVGDILWELGNILWRQYAGRKLHQQATELAKTFGALQPSEGSRLEGRGFMVAQSTLAQSYYWRGRLGVVLLDFRQSRDWLDRAWRNCPDGAWQQQRAILIRLIPVSLLLGKLPTQETLQTYDLEQPFGPLIHAFRTGNVAAWRQLLEAHREWLRARSIWLLLFERGEILVWRNLFRKALRIYYETDAGAAKNRVPTWVFTAAVARAFAGTGELEDGSVTLEDVICVLSSLIDQAIILGNVSYSQKQLVMRPAEDGMGGFPRIADVRPRAVQAIR
ncbi:hypothetical protein Q8F55_004593 [Vanrija albida]|uniref:PCI domain-containing protein n=1 Tax=Vanrija albida TaxID=181172 RepID=A0ABR3Q768_9TREE